MFTRVPIQLRVAPTPLAQIDKTAKDFDLTRADVMRACLAVSFNHWTEVCGILEQKSEQM